MTWKDNSYRFAVILSLVGVGLLCAGLGLFLWLREPGPGRIAPESSGLEQPLAVRAKTNQFRNLVFPTAAKLDRGDESVFQPTASGRPESALYGSVRTKLYNKGLAASFHEGVDIAACQRDAAGRPQDAVCAVAAGAVAYVNTVVGNSNYGKYVALVHSCPSGTVYTLYAHLAAISPGVAQGSAVKAGDVLGVLGHTANPPIPRAQAHLHFEVGLIMNARFSRWFRLQNLKPNHGNFNGWNLLAVDPLAVFEKQRQSPDFDFFNYIAALPPAFEIVLATRNKPDYFERYPSLWEGAPYLGAGLKMEVSGNGLPIKGRNAVAAERELLGSRRSAVLRVNRETLGRNGCHLVVCRNGAWRLSSEGEKWLKILTY